MPEKIDKIFYDSYTRAGTEKLRATVIIDKDEQPLYELRFYRKREDGKFYPTRNGIKFSWILLNDFLDIFNNFISYQDKCEKDKEKRQKKESLKILKDMIKVYSKLEKVFAKEGKDFKPLKKKRDELIKDYQEIMSKKTFE